MRCTLTNRNLLRLRLLYRWQALIFEISSHRMVSRNRSPNFKSHQGYQTLNKTMLRTVASRVSRVAGRRTFQSSTRALAEADASAAEATQVTLNFAVPYQPIYDASEG